MTTYLGGERCEIPSKYDIMNSIRELDQDAGEQRRIWKFVPNFMRDVLRRLRTKDICANKFIGN